MESIILMFSAIFLGVLAGTFTGLAPGIHINLVAATLLSLRNFIPFADISLVIFIVSMSITHTFLDFIPAIFLGAPEEDNFLAILPGHEMLKQGKAKEAIAFTIYGSIIGVIITIILTPFFIAFLPFIETKVRMIIPFILIFISLYIILEDKKIFSSLLIFIMAGFLGYVSLNLPIKEPLFPLLTGLFGASALTISIKNKVTIPEQSNSIEKPKKEDITRSLLAAIISIPITAFLPGLGSGHTATIGSEIIKQSRKSFLILIGSVNTAIMGLSFIVLYSLGKTRTGSAVFIKEIFPEISFYTLLIIIGSIIISAAISSILALKVSSIFSKSVSKINYRLLSNTILIFLFILSFILSGFLGILVFIASTSLGIWAIESNSRRINLMGCLIIPTILFYLF